MPPSKTVGLIHKLDRRYATRPKEGGFLQCGLYVNPYEIERNFKFKYLKLKVNFKSNCFTGIATKVIEIRRAKRTPYFFRLNLKGHIFVW